MLELENVYYFFSNPTPCEQSQHILLSLSIMKFVSQQAIYPCRMGDETKKKKKCCEITIILCLCIPHGSGEGWLLLVSIMSSKKLVLQIMRKQTLSIQNLKP